MKFIIKYRDENDINTTHQFIFNGSQKDLDDYMDRLKELGCTGVVSERGGDDYVRKNKQQAEGREV